MAFDSGPNFKEFFPTVMDILESYSKILGIDEYQKYCKNEEIEKKKRWDKYSEFLEKIKTDILIEVKDELGEVIPEWLDLLKIHS